MGLMLVIGIAWIALAVSVAVLVGRAIRAADAGEAIPASGRAAAGQPDARILRPRFPVGQGSAKH